MIKKFTVLLVLVVSHFASAQKPTKIELVHANTLEYDESRALGSSKVKRLIGKVIFKHDNVLLHCDSAYLYSETNTLEAFSNVHIEEGDSLNLYGDFLKYDGNTKKAELHGNVKLLQNDMTLTTEHLNQDLNTNIGRYYDGGNIIDSENNLYSTIGHYYSNTREFFFKDSVVLINPEYTMNSDTLRYNTISEIAYFFEPTTIKSKENLIYCENGWYDTKNDLSQFNKNAFIQSKEHTIRGDSLFYDKNKGYGQAFKNIEITDTVENIIINGDYAEFFEENEITIITGKAMLTQVYDEDSLFLHADTLKATYDSTGNHRILYAFNKAKFYKHDLQGKCDSLIYSYRDSTIRLYNEPVLWTEENQLTAMYIEIKTGDDGVRALRLDTNAFIISKSPPPAPPKGGESVSADSTEAQRSKSPAMKKGHSERSEKPPADSTYHAMGSEGGAAFNQIKGKNMKGYFIDNQLYKIEVTGNGQTIYYAQEDDGSFIGVNKIDCSDMMILVKDNTIDKITFITEPEATLYPMGELDPKELLLRDFKWLEEKRPRKKEDIFIYD